MAVSGLGRDANSLEVFDDAFVWNHLLTPHWVDSFALTLNVNISHGGLRLRGRLCRYEAALYANMAKGRRNDMGQAKTSSAVHFGARL